MPPAIGIGFLSLTGIIFIAYIVFLIQEQKSQDEIARHCRGTKGGTLTVSGVDRPEPLSR